MRQYFYPLPHSFEKRPFITYKDQRSHSFWVIVFVTYSGKWHFQTKIWPTSANFRQQWPIPCENLKKMLNFGIYDLWVELGSLGEKSIWNFNTYQVLEALIFTIQTWSQLQIKGIFMAFPMVYHLFFYKE